MVIPWSVPWIEMHTTERFLRTLSEERWGLTNSEGELTVMVEDQAEQSVSEGSGYLILPEQEHSGPAVAVGDDDVLIGQIDELAAMFREFARAADPNQSKVYYDVNKAIYRCVDVLIRCADEHRRA